MQVPVEASAVASQTVHVLLATHIRVATTLEVGQDGHNVLDTVLHLIQVVERLVSLHIDRNVLFSI